VRPHHRNPGTSLDLDWVRGMRVRRAAIDACVTPLEAARTSPGARRLQLLLRVVQCIDLTYLEEDGTEQRVRAVCARARQPLSPQLARTLGEAAAIQAAAVCVHHRFLPVALAALEGSGVSVAVVSAGFPHGGGPLAGRVAEIRASVAAGADEIDAVIPRAPALAGDWQSLYDEIRAYRAACGDAILKTILATGALASLDDVARASAVCLMAGANFLKTSTGRETVNATLPAGVVMARVIRAYRRRTGTFAGLKPAGGITTAEQALAWARLVERELGARALHPASFRLGASRLLDDIDRALTPFGVVTGLPAPRAGGPARRMEQQPSGTERGES
jgi:deoxyribose-phosphate aldolase